VIGKASKLASVVAAVLAVAAAVPARAAENDKRTTVHIGVIGILAEAGLYVAAERGYFTEEGLNVELLKDMVGADAFPGLATGQIDGVGGSFGPELANAVLRGVRIKMVAGLNSYIPGWDAGALTVRKELIDSGRVKDWKDLKGLKIGITAPLPNMTDFFASRYLANGGLTFDDVQFVTVPFPNMITALKTGGIDAAHTSEPMTTLAVDNKIAVKWRPVSTYAPTGLTVAILQFGPSLLDKAPDVGERVVTAYLRGARYYDEALARADGKAEIAPILMKYTPLKDRAIYDRITFSYAPPDAEITLSGLQAMSSYYATHNGPDAGDVSKLVDDRFRQAALKRLGPYNK
jgi:NitT/TauT family transport system substrate-binding protein